MPGDEDPVSAFPPPPHRADASWKTAGPPPVPHGFPVRTYGVDRRPVAAPHTTDLASLASLPAAETHAALQDGAAGVMAEFQKLVADLVADGEPLTPEDVAARVAAIEKRLVGLHAATNDLRARQAVETLVDLVRRQVEAKTKSVEEIKDLLAGLQSDVVNLMPFIDAQLQLGAVVPMQDQASVGPHDAAARDVQMAAVDAHDAQLADDAAREAVDAAAALRDIAAAL